MSKICRRFALIIMLIVLSSIFACSFATENEQPDHIYAWAENITGHTFSSTTPLDSDASALYLLYPEAIFCGVGGVGRDCAKFLHPTLGKWSDDELWSIYGNLVQYISENAALIYADALRHNPDIDSTRIMIGVYFSDNAFISFYDIIDKTFSSQLVDLNQ